MRMGAERCVFRSLEVRPDRTPAAMSPVLYWIESDARYLSETADVDP